ncbi:MAG TPA: copper homeostasis membrane protein CopD [Pseudolabrys sp.]|nr:copper homeostasis membrane protein CopD [Pseudolabrys sp.]
MIADPLIYVRSLHIAATLLASGTAAFLVFVAEPAGTKLRAEFAALGYQLVILIWVALAVAVVSGAAWLALLASNILGASLADVCLHGGAWPVLVDTRFGMVWCMRLVLALLLAVLVLWPVTRGLQVAAAAALTALPALVGHAGATPGLAGDFHLLSDVIHLLAAGAWLGGLPAFVWSLWRARRTAKPAWRDFAIRSTRRFSVVGILSVGALLASGVVNSWYLLGSPGNFVATDYGRLVALKIGLFAAMVAIATVNRFYLTPRLPAVPALRTLQRNSVAEICLGLCVLLFVGMLGTLPPSVHTHAAFEGIPPAAAFVHIHGPEAMTDVMINPGHPGQADVTIRVSREDMSLFPAKDVRLVLEPPEPGGRPVEQKAVEQADQTWLVSGITVSEPGIWTVRVIVRPDSGEPIDLDAPIVIKR